MNNETTCSNSLDASALVGLTVVEVEVISLCQKGIYFGVGLAFCPTVNLNFTVSYQKAGSILVPDVGLGGCGLLNNRSYSCLCDLRAWGCPLFVCNRCGLQILRILEKRDSDHT